MPNSPQPPRRLWAGLVIALGSCAPPLSLAGKLCSTERPCPTGWECSNGSCSGNRVKNGSFESGVAGWVTSHGSVVAVDGGRGSMGAAQWNPDGKGESLLTLGTPAVDAPATGAWCAQAWVQGGDGEEVSFDLLQDVEVADTGTVRASGGVWTRAQASMLLVFSQPLSVQLRSPADAGVRQLLVDDVALWQDAEGDRCAVPP